MKKNVEDGSGTRLMMTPSNYSPEDSLADDLPSDDEEIPRLKLLDSDQNSSSRSPSPWSIRTFVKIISPSCGNQILSPILKFIQFQVSPAVISDMFQCF